MTGLPMRSAMTGLEIRDFGDGIWDDGEWISWAWINEQLEAQESGQPVEELEIEEDFENESPEPSAELLWRILAAKMKLGLFDKPYDFGDPARETAPLDRATARELAARSIVLLRNEGSLLPLAAGKKLALIGALADDASSALGSWRARGQANDVVTLRQALGERAEYAPGVSVRSDDASGIPAAVEAANRADIVLLALGECLDGVDQ